MEVEENGEEVKEVSKEQSESEEDEDPNNDPNDITLSPEEKKTARLEFNKIDFNRCGYVDIQELKELMISI